MKKQILDHLEDPKKMEQLYRKDRNSFKKAFLDMYQNTASLPKSVGEFWYHRLSHEAPKSDWGSPRELVVVLILALVGGFIAQLPIHFDIAPLLYYPRNAGFIAFSLLTVYFAWKNQLSQAKVGAISLLSLVAVVYINVLPQSEELNDTYFLACLSLPIVLWALLGWAFMKGDNKIISQRLAFLRFNGDLLVIVTMILLAGMVLSGLTLGLFSLIELNIETFYFNYVVLTGLGAAPIVGTFILQTHPHIVDKVSPLIARVFSPLVFLTLGIYLIAIIISGKNPYNDREFLILFNLLLLGVMAILLFALNALANTQYFRIESRILFLLSIVAIGLNLILVSALLFRMVEGGITPNRLAALGADSLILANLVQIARKLYRSLPAENAIATFFPFYILWAAIVCFVFPVVFSFR